MRPTCGQCGAVLTDLGAMMFECSADPKHYIWAAPYDDTYDDPDDYDYDDDYERDLEREQARYDELLDKALDEVLT